MKTGMACCAVVLAGIVLGGQAAAQAPVPTVTINASPTAVSVNATGPLPAGPTRFDLVGPADGEDVAVYIALLVPGVTVDQVARSLADADRTGSEAVLGLVSIQASATISGRDTHRALTFNVKPGLTYVVIAEPDTEGGDGKVKPRAFTSFTSSSAANGATAPAADATVRFQGLRFKGSKTLPRQGAISFENRDGAGHFALAFPLRKGTSRKRLGRTLKGDVPFGKVVNGAPYMAQNVISGGDTANVQEVSFARKGRFGLVCFVDRHDQLGMYRIVKVK